MTSPIAAYDLGRIAYREALGFQHRAVSARAAGAGEDAIYFAEHEPVLTVGRGGTPESLRASDAMLKARGVEVVPVERGGDITYHGPGQIVAYPIVALSALPSGRDMHRYLRDLEEVLIRALGTYGLSAGRRPPYTGVWVGERKVAAIGVAVRRWITFHGFALNVDPDLTHFDWIHPCGIRDLGVTSMRSLLGSAPPRAEALERLCSSFAEIWERPVTKLSRLPDSSSTPSSETLHA
ncbi:MAG TPA: lipoyl(octanoyl) transferase LipB [Candidatus Limnocylindrales bacterium]|nr:lipoyl(octanoyl) transferase LipB [Candidatus Limnocylindrales bacterium]